MQQEPPLFKDSNGNGTLDAAEMLASLDDPALQKRIRATQSWLERQGADWANGSLKSFLKKHAAGTDAYNKELDEYVAIIRKEVQEVVDRFPELKTMFPNGVELTREDVPALVQKFCVAPKDRTR